MIRIILSGSEQSSNRIDAFKYALDMALTESNRKELFGEIEIGNPACDILFINDDGRQFGVETKTLDDFWASLESQDRHLDNQLRSFVQTGNACCFLVLGSFDDLPPNVPPMIQDKKTHKIRPKTSNEREFSLSEADRFLTQRAGGCRVHTYFLSKNPVKSFAYILRLVVAEFSEPNPTSHQPKSVPGLKSLDLYCKLPRIKITRARELYRIFGSFVEFCVKIRQDPNILYGIKLNNRRISDKDVKTILDYLEITQ